MNKINQDEDIDLISKIKKNQDEISLKILINKHSGLYNSLYKKYSNPLTISGVYPDDFLKQKDYIIYKSALSFDSSKKTKFSTWLYNQIRYHCLNCINANSRYITMENNAINFLVESNQPILRKEEENDYIFSILDKLSDKRIIKIFKLRYFSNKKLTPWNIIGKKLKLSTQTVINLHNKTLKFLKTKIESKNLFDKI